MGKGKLDQRRIRGSQMGEQFRSSSSPVGFFSLSRASMGGGTGMTGRLEWRSSCFSSDTSQTQIVFAVRQIYRVPFKGLAGSGATSVCTPTFQGPSADLDHEVARKIPRTCCSSPIKTSSLRDYCT